MTPCMFKAYVVHGYVQCFIHASTDRTKVEWMAHLGGGVVHEYRHGEFVRAYKPGRW